MDAAQIKAACALVGEILNKPTESKGDGAAVGKLALQLLENFLLEQKRQTELLEWLANMANAAENARLGR